MTGEFTEFERALIRALIWIQAISGILGLLALLLRGAAWLLS